MSTGTLGTQKGHWQEGQGNVWDTEVAVIHCPWEAVGRGGISQGSTRHRNTLGISNRGIPYRKLVIHMVVYTQWSHIQRFTKQEPLPPSPQGSRSKRRR